MASKSKNLPNFTEEYVITVSLMFVSAGCVLFSGFMYNKYSTSSLQLITTRPFVDFGSLDDIYFQNKVLSGAIAMNRTLMSRAWCTELSSDINSRPETRSPACTCINSVYADYMKNIIILLTGNTTRANIMWQYYQAPWITNPGANSFISNYSSSTLVITDAMQAEYTKSTLQCLQKRSTWVNSPYLVNINPLAMSFYCSSALFMLAWSLVLRVMANTHTGEWAKWFLFFIAVGCSAFLFVSDIASNWVYAVALLCIAINFVTSLNDEFSSMVEEEEHQLPLEVFYPPHPIVIGLWYYIQIAFPIMVVYLGLSNLQRDVMALLGYYVVGFIIASSIQRMFWVKWYIRRGIKVINKHTHTAQSSAKFQFIMLLFLAIIFIMTMFLGTMLVFMQWYNQNFMSGNWFAMIIGMVYTLVFFLEFLDKPNEKAHGTNGLQLGPIQLVQIYLVVAINVGFVIATAADATIN
jgi:hypothetical protein